MPVVVLLAVALLPLLPPEARGDRDASAGLLRAWRLVRGRHWQIASSDVESPADTDAREGTRGTCDEGMVDVRGRMKLDGQHGSIESLQLTTCRAWVDRDSLERCARFDRVAWRELSRDLPTRAMRYCIDRFEYPNRRGAYPLVDVSYREAAQLCADDGKRLCTEDEWTFACEGEEATPYPTGYLRDADACVIDRPTPYVDEKALWPRARRAAAVEIDRLWQGEASGARGCRSSLGVYDTVGNVDEWTASVRPGERPSILKGGFWGPVRARCRPSTRAHGEDYSYYQQGFRCCRDPAHDG